METDERIERTYNEEVTNNFDGSDNNDKHSGS